ncbi:thermostable beta-glucosidase B, partial [Yersinia pestis PY-76]
MSGWGQDPPA